MKKLMSFVLLALILSACSGVKVEQQPTVSATATQVVVTPENTQIPVPTSTPVPQNSWKLPEPPKPDQLPTQLSVEIKYIEPPVNCAKDNDPNQTCSTKKGQSTDSDFTLKSGEALVMTGDGISVSQEGKVLVERPSFDTNHDLWIVANNSKVDLNLHMTAPYGSFRGYFKPLEGGWTVKKVTHLRNLHLYLFLLPMQTYDRFTPTPVPNCESRYGCDTVNDRTLVFDDNGWHVADYGLYIEGEPFWQDLLKALGM
jgi:hypothetical protein